MIVWTLADNAAMTAPPAVIRLDSALRGVQPRTTCGEREQAVRCLILDFWTVADNADTGLEKTV